MTKPSPSYQELYTLVDSRTKEIMDKFDGLEKRVSGLESFKGQVLFVGGIAIFAINFVADWVKIKLGIK